RTASPTCCRPTSSDDRFRGRFVRQRYVMRIGSVTTIFEAPEQYPVVQYIVWGPAGTGTSRVPLNRVHAYSRGQNSTGGGQGFSTVPSRTTRPIHPYPSNAVQATTT